MKILNASLFGTDKRHRLKKEKKYYEDYMEKRRIHPPMKRPHPPLKFEGYMDAYPGMDVFERRRFKMQQREKQKRKNKERLDRMWFDTLEDQNNTEVPFPTWNQRKIRKGGYRVAI